MAAFCDSTRANDRSGYWCGDKDGLPKAISLQYVDKNLEVWLARQSGGALAPNSEAWRRRYVTGKYANLIES